MIERGLIITGSDAELLRRALSEVKTKAYEESEAQLDDTQALDALVSCFRKAENDGQEKERPHSFFSPLRKRLVLGTIIDMKDGATKFYNQSSFGYTPYNTSTAPKDPTYRQTTGRDATINNVALRIDSFAFVTSKVSYIMQQDEFVTWGTASVMPK